MRFAAAMFLAMCALGACAQDDVWRGVSPEYNPPQLQDVALTKAQTKALAGVLRKAGGWECSGAELDELIAGLHVTTVPAGEGKRLVLLEAGAGCARGGTRLERRDVASPL